LAESALSRLRARLNRGDSWLTYDVGRLLARDGLDEQAIEEIETRLLRRMPGSRPRNFSPECLRVRVEAREKSATRAS